MSLALLVLAARELTTSLPTLDVPVAPPEHVVHALTPAEVEALYLGSL